MMKRGEIYNSLRSVDIKKWKSGRSLHLPVGGAARPWLCRGIEEPLLVLLPDARHARNFLIDANSISAMPEMRNFPSVELLPEMALASFADDPQLLEAQKAERGEAMSRWAEKGGILVSTPGALMGPFSIGGDILELRLGEGVGRSRLIEWLSAKGYERVDIVWSHGQYTYRGGIVDFFDPKGSYPIRVEFLDDEIESMRYFATDTQRRVGNISRTGVSALSSRKKMNLEDFFQAGMRVIFVEPLELENAAENYAWLLFGAERDIERAGRFEREGMLQWRDIELALALRPRIRIMADAERGEHETRIVGLPNFRGRRRDLESYCQDLTSKGASVRIVSDIEHFRDWAVRSGYEAIDGTVSEGFFDSAGGVALIGDLELSGLSLSGGAVERRVPLDWGDRLLPGQWVVHEDYGVARYMGSEQLESEGGMQEYLVLEYAEERRLKIPVMHFHKISRYQTYPGIEPAADSLKGGHWKKLSLKAREQAETAARYLIDVYAKREITRGHAFTGDPGQEREFELAFPFRETSDQLRAIDDVLRDMARPVPMDRLLVGDVGFGKTEVALRASARAVFEGRQVAVMAPTTLLAQQHFDTFNARFDSFGVRVEVISRFVAPSKQRAILVDTAAGKVDILLGTHRLISPDIAFKDLGLVIVDEEHRFGVMHKEHLKNLYPSADILMLSATPIPRSLHMSLSGLRDLSLLQIPPQKRLPVITAVGPWSEPLVKNAVIREKARGGQIFYVHNRVASIDREAMTVRRLFPKLRIGTAHGQMPEKQLKSAMDKFAGGDLDLLVCTTIVESGLDIPRANTLIVSDAHELGLAQMHQLRGRVGRRDEQAFALFLHPANSSLTKEASERLEAIAALGEFGAGYELAKRDLEIRGGGELVGVAQHGNLGRVGFQRYCDLLSEAITRAKGEYKEATIVEVDMPTAIPYEYLPHESVRVALYRKLLWAQDIGSLQSLHDETIERFGPMPKVLEFLFDIAKIKILGPDYTIVKVLCGRDETVIERAVDGSPKEMQTPHGWFRRSNGFIGPGGFGALGSFIKASCYARR